jgi:hypothetical protein
MGNDLRSPLRMRGQHAVVEHPIDRGPRCQGRQLLEELHRPEEQMRRPIAPRVLELQAHGPVGQTPEAVFGQRWPKHVAAQLLQPRSVVGTHPHVRVQIEPVEVRVAWAARSHCGRRQPTADPADLRPRPGAESHTALRRSAHDAGERWPRPGDRIFGARAVLAGLETAAAQEPSHASPNRGEHLRHLGVARPHIAWNVSRPAGDRTNTPSRASV